MACIHLWYMFSPQKSISVFLHCNLSKFNLTLHFLAVSSKVVNTTFIISMILLLAYNHDVICNDSHLFNQLKALIKLVLKYIPSNSSTKWYDSVPKSTNLSIEGGQEWWSFIMFWCQYPFLQSHAVIMQASASKWAMFSGILKWYGSLIIVLFRFVGSKQNTVSGYLTCPCFLQAQNY